MSSLIDRFQLVAGVVPVNLATAANDGDWVSMKNFRRLVVMVFKGAGGASEDPTITMEQATAVAGTSAKALNFTTIYSKEGADLTTIGPFTKTVQASGNTYTNTSLGDLQALIWLEFSAEDLDQANGFDCVRARIADVGSTSQIGCILYLLGDPRNAPVYAGSAIVD